MFPATSLDLLIEAYFDGWVDLSDRLLTRPVTIPQRGAPNGARSTAAGSASVTLDDDDGALTPLNPSGIYYPHVRRGAPHRVAVRRLNDAFDGTVAAGWGTGWTSFAAGGTITPSDSSVSGGSAVHSVPAANAFRANYYDGVSLADAEVRTVFGLPDTTITGGPVEPGNLMLRLTDLSTYYLVRVEVDASEAVLLSLHHTATGAIAGPLATGITYSGQQIAVAGICVGPMLAAKIWEASGDEPRDWQIEVTDQTYLGRGYCGIRSGVAASNSDTKPVVFEYASFEIRAPRAYGAAASYRPAIVPRTDRTMAAAQTIEIGGLLRQLERGRSGPRSAATRHTAATEPIAYWPLEDGVDSTQAASGLSDGLPLTVRAGIMDFVDDAPPGASGGAHPLPSAENALLGSIVGASATSWQVSVWSKGQVTQAADDGGLTAYYVPWEIVTTAGQVVRLAYQYEEDRAIGVAQWTGLDQVTPANVVFLDDTVSPHTNPGITGEWIHVQFYIEQAGADCNAFLYVNGENVDAQVWPSLTIGAPRDIAVMSPFGAGNATSLNVEEIWISQLAVHNGGFLVEQYAAGLGFPGELAHTRVERVCGEEGISVHVTLGPDDSAAMGAQPTATVLDVLRECEAADMAILGESRAALALTFRTGSARQNLPVGLTVDLATYNTTAGTSGSVLTPVYDDQGLRNEIEARRTSGSSVVALDQASIDADGRYDESVEVNVARDDQLPSVAHWLLSQGIVDVYRNPALALDLGANPDLIDAWLSVDHGSRVQRTNPPGPRPPGPIDQIITGYAESLEHRSWTATANCQPAGPWDTAEVDGEGRIPADGSALGSTLSESGTLLSVTSTAENGLWNPEPAEDWPLDLRVGGERITVDALGSVLNANPMIRDAGTTGWVGSNATISRDLTHQQHPDWGALLVVPNGSSTSGGANSAARVAISPSTQYLAMCWVWATNSMQLGPAVDWHTAAGVYISTGFVGPVTVSAGVWTLVSGLLTAPGTAGQAPMRARHAGTPPASSTWWVTGICLIPVSSYTASPQSMTIGARGVNGVSREWAAGTPVDVWSPLIVAW